MHATLEEIRLLGIVPVVTIDSADDAEPLAQALINGGLPCAEVTFRTAAAREALDRLARTFPSLLLGAGTVLTVDQAKAALDAGARFIVSPGTSPSVVRFCREKSVPVTPGVVTPTEVQTVLELGVEVVKFFPAEPAGGIGYLKALSGPFKDVRFIPTGGITEAHLLAYLRTRGVIACGGSWMVKPELIAARKFDEIEKFSARAVQTLLGLSIEFVGVGELDINPSALDRLRSLLPVLPPKGLGQPSSSSHHAQLHGSREHGITIRTHFLERAARYFARRGVGTRDNARPEQTSTSPTMLLDLEIDGLPVRLARAEP